MATLRPVLPPSAILLPGAVSREHAIAINQAMDADRYWSLIWYAGARVHTTYGAAPHAFFPGVL